MVLYMSLICPRCGSKEEDKQFIESFCVDCYRFDIRIPEKGDIQFKFCPRCERIYIQGAWQQFNSRKVRDYIKRKCKGEFEDMDYDLDKQIAIFKINVKGKEYQIRKKLSYEMEKNLCDDCNRSSGGYFEGILQIRGTNHDKCSKYADSMNKILGKKTFVSKIDEKKEGIDLYVGSSKAVMNLLKEGGLKPLITRKLFGRKEGKRIYRTTFRILVE